MSNNLIHIATIKGNGGRDVWLFLRKIEANRFKWLQHEGEREESLSIEANSVEEALRLARAKFKNQSFRSLGCGYRFTLPERDEHGNNALFHQAVKSMTAMTGVYFDEELGHNCIVHQIPSETRQLYEKLKANDRL